MYTTILYILSNLLDLNIPKSTYMYIHVHNYHLYLISWRMITCIYTTSSASILFKKKEIQIFQFIKLSLLQNTLNYNSLIEAS